MGSFYIFVYKLNILPFGSLHSSPLPEGVIAIFFDRIKYMIVPISTVVFVKFWGNAYLNKSLILQVLQEDYIISARGRGLPERKILFGHALRTASPAIVTLSVSSLLSSLSGDIYLEIVLAWPGIGLKLWEAISMSDIHLELGILTVFALIYCIAFAILDITYAFLDPRIKY